MALFENKTKEQKLTRLIRIGKVSSVDCAKGTARVAFNDYDKMVSFDLPVLQTNTYRNKDYSMPDIGENVLCLFLPNGTVEGFIIGSFYSDAVTPPESSGNYRSVKFADGTFVRYDRDKHELTAEIGATKITANQKDVLVNTQNSVIVTAANNVTVNTKAAVVNAETSYVLNTKAATLTAPAIVLDGNVAVNGTLTASVDVIASGKSLVSHAHTGNAGKPTSSPI